MTLSTDLQHQVLVQKDENQVSRPNDVSPLCQGHVQLITSKFREIDPSEVEHILTNELD